MSGTDFSYIVDRKQIDDHSGFPINQFSEIKMNDYSELLKADSDKGILTVRRESRDNLVVKVESRNVSDMVTNIAYCGMKLLKPNMSTLIESQHEVRDENPCEEDGVVRQNATFLEAELNQKPQSGLQKCDFCERTFTRKASLLTHRANIHAGQTTDCTKCGKRFACKMYLDLHTKRVHQVSNEPFTNKTCGNLPLSSLHTSAVTRTLDEKSDLKCTICFKDFKRRQSLLLHMEVHLGTQKYVCGICDARFSRRSDLERHKTRHTGELPYKCKLCQTRFRLPGDLGRHVRNVHGKGNTCSVCGKKYVRKFELRKHEALHFKNGEEKENTGPNFTCGVCKAVLSTKVNYKNHLKTHEGRDKGYTCVHCGKCYSTSSNLSKHVKRNHSGLIYTCDTCDKQFKCMDYLKTHVLTVHI